MISARSKNRALKAILRIPRDILSSKSSNVKNFFATALNDHFVGGNRRPTHLRPPQPPPPPLLYEPRALSDLDPQPPPLLPLKADEPPLFSCDPQPDALDLWALFE